MPTRLALEHKARSPWHTKACSALDVSGGVWERTPWLHEEQTARQARCLRAGCSWRCASMHCFMTQRLHAHRTEGWPARKRHDASRPPKQPCITLLSAAIASRIHEVVQSGVVLLLTCMARCAWQLVQQ